MEEQSKFYAKAFLLRNAFSKSINEFNENEGAVMSVKNENDVFLAVKKAYADFQPRTLVKMKEWWKNGDNVENGKRLSEKERQWQKEKENVFGELAKKIVDVFKEYKENNKMSESFDTIHKDLCRFFKVSFDTVSKNFGGYEDICYGKAQKMINMTFKYLFCFDDAQDYLDIFKCCHMAIDRVVLRWYYGTIEINIPANERCIWSNLSESQYDNIQSNIITYLAADDSRTDLERLPFFAEFRIWEQYRPN